jgi:hypothetical protein
MAFINCGVHAPYNASKKALKEAVKADATKVRFYGTAAFGPGFDGTAADIPAGHILVVVGPDPYRSRKWYANVARKPDGSVTVK